MKFWTPFINKIKGLGYTVKVVNDQGEEVPEDELENAADLHSSFEGMLQAAIADSFTQIQDTVVNTLVERIKADPEFANQFVEASAERITEAADAAIEAKIKGLRTEINQIKGAATGHGVKTPGELNQPNGKGKPEEEKNLSGAANKGNSEAYVNRLVEQGILPAAQRDKILGKA